MTDLRTQIVEMLRAELIGPSRQLPAVQLGQRRDEEILRQEDPPRSRYGAGILFPGGERVETQDGADNAEPANVTATASDVYEAVPDEQPSSPVDSHSRSFDQVDDRQDGESLTDLEVNRANEYLPSAIGITALVRIPAELCIRVTAATYEKVEMAGRGWKKRDGTKVAGHGWWRTPIDATIRFEKDRLLGPGPAILQVPVPNAEGLYIHVFSRAPSNATVNPEERVVTTTLINRREQEKERAGDDECFFQCAISIQGPDSSECIREYPSVGSSANDDPEELSLRLLYRHRRIFGVGHGTAVEWAESEKEGIDRIWSDALPSFEIKPIVPSTFPGLELSMLRLSENEGMYAAEIARSLSSAYLSWIEEQMSVLSRDHTLPASLRQRGVEHLEACSKCHSRIAFGASLLASNVQVRRAFALMNRAMLMQSEHYRIASQNIRGWHPVEGNVTALRPESPFKAPAYETGARVWRPFQLAFILMNLRSIQEPASSERELVDVIWFPTGGGKTEAYLGLAAFTILLRRMRKASDAGTVVLMRYTLRLLTTQQFQRAASLICALETIRRQDPSELGSTPITIGLWVGNKVTPGTEEEAVEKLRSLQRDGVENPFILRSCPWCGVEMGVIRVNRGQTRVKGYRQLNGPKRVRFLCDDPDCAFGDGEGLPVQLIDEHLYSSPPTILIGTVDKFAMIPWNPECKSLFGLHSDGPHSPPELIIQDELHLISGPLGSMVGHYETLIDLLCQRPDGTKAKIVASTATIARSTEQIRALYARGASQLFPPQGLRAGESFFAHEDRAAFGRTYVGVFASGLPSQVTTQVRTIGALLQAPKSLPTQSDSELDRYWTLMVYFNSIRELGHAATLVRADIVEYMSAMWERMGISRHYMAHGAPDQRRFINRDLELTSRISSSEVTEVMNGLFTRVGESHSKPIDVCLATNMVQVGLDVPRLNLMAIVGQPKTSSEYIQASSRVGREAPGLVVTILNPGKPRDRSHFEHFKAYHQSIYRFVEPTSVTPFSLPVRERAMHALIIALARLWGPKQLEECPDPAPDERLVARIRSALIDRVKFVDAAERGAAEKTFDDFLLEWKRVPPTRYGWFGAPNEEVPLMFPAGSQELPEWGGRARATPSSMRNVDATCNASAISRYPGLES